VLQLSCGSVLIIGDEAYVCELSSRPVLVIGSVCMYAVRIGVIFVSIGVDRVYRVS
jgi:ABC-type siderophore export system fused ATPase/permease subunit